MYKRGSIIGIKTVLHGIVVLGILVLILIFASVQTEREYAHADSASIEIVSITSQSVEIDPNDSRFIITDRTINDKDIYSANIELTFRISGAGYYCIGTVTDGGTEFLESRMPVDGADITYRVKADGMVQVNIYAFINAQDTTAVATESRSVKSDSTAPNALASVSEMDSWLLGGDYNITVDFSGFDDAVSGRGEVWYSFEYTDPALIGTGYVQVDFTKGDILTIPISWSGRLTVYYFDLAYNLVIREYDFNKFHTTAPIITATPNVDRSLSEYAGYFTVSINFADDKSDSEQRYVFLAAAQGAESTDVVYNEVFNYTGEFRVHRPCTVRAYYFDRIHNRSEIVEYRLDASLFDIDPPDVVSHMLTVDIKKEQNCRLELDLSDLKSGVKSATIKQNNISMQSSAGGYYFATFNGLGLLTLDIDLEDMAGNKTVYIIQLMYFNNSTLCTKIADYTARYIDTDFSQYNDSTVAEINSAYDKFSLFLMADNTRTNDFDDIMLKIDSLLSGTSNYVYIIKNQPQYLSAIIRFTVDEAKIVGLKKGDTVRLEFSAGESGSTDYVALSGLGRGFADYFRLQLFHNGTKISPNGVKIEMDMPQGYFSRSFVLVDREAGNEVELDRYNNKLVFTCVGEEYALVISGGREKDALTSQDGKKTLRVFGREMELGVFLGVVLGSAGGLAVLVTVLIVLNKRKNKG